MPYADVLSLQAEVLAHGFSSNRYSDRIITWLDEGAMRLARESGIRVNQTANTISTVANTASYDLPSDFAKLINVSNTVEGEILRPYNLYERDTAETGTSRPRFYNVYGTQITFHPTPDKEYSIRLRYYKLPTDVVLGAPPNFPDDYWYLLIEYALMKAYRSEHDYEAATIHENTWTQGLMKLKGELQNDTHDGPLVVEGTWGPKSPMWG